MFLFFKPPQQHFRIAIELSRCVVTYKFEKHMVVMCVFAEQLYVFSPHCLAVCKRKMLMRRPRKDMNIRQIRKYGFKRGDVVAVVSVLIGLPVELEIAFSDLVYQPQSAFVMIGQCAAVKLRTDCHFVLSRASADLLQIADDLCAVFFV